MGSTGQRGNAISFLTSERPHFFKIILEDTIKAAKLAIPRKFVKNYGSSLPKSVSLRVPSGAVWEVELLKQNDDIWLRSGWTEFAKCYSLDYGHLLVFEYRKCSQFHVLIFDQSATEINYSCYSPVSGEESKADEENEKPETVRSVDENSVEILDDLSAIRRARKTSTVKSPCPRKKMRNESAGRTGSISLSVPHSRQNGEYSGPKIGMSSGWRRSKAGVNRKWALNNKEKAEAFQRANAFQSENPYFMVVMQPSYVNPGCRLNIPVEFGRDHLAGKRRNDVSLCVCDGRSWSAEYVCSPHSSRVKPGFGNGWKEFVHDNSLEIGDVCVFELIKSSRITFKVFFFRVREYPNTHHRSLGHGSTLKMLEPKESSKQLFYQNFTGSNEGGMSILYDL